MRKEAVWIIFSRCDGRMVLVALIVPTARLGRCHGGSGFARDVAGKFPFWLARCFKIHICR